MAAQSIAGRPRRAQQTEPDDVILARALHFSEWARRNVMLVSIVAVVLVVTIGGLFWYRAEQARQRDAAAVAFLQVEQAVMAGEETTAARELQLFIQQHGGTIYADEARLLLAQLHLRGERYDEAIEVLTPAASNIGSPLGAQAGLLLGAAQEGAGQMNEAIATYLRVASEAREEFRRQEALMGAALLRQELGDHAGASELYARLVASAEEGSAQRMLFEMRLAEAEALAASQ